MCVIRRWNFQGDLLFAFGNYDFGGLFGREGIFGGTDMFIEEFQNVENMWAVFWICVNEFSTCQIALFALRVNEVGSRVGSEFPCGLTSYV